MKIAVVGSGISGLSSAYYLSKKHKVDLFEKQDRFGGHSYTLDVEYNDKERVAVDIGFMVFNKITYPNLINFFKENEIEIEKSDMSFSVTVKGTNIEYCGKGLNGIFSNRGNLFNAKLMYVNKIFKAKNLSESQKTKVINAFDRATSVKEVENTYKTLLESVSADTKKSSLKESVGFASKPIGSAPARPIVETDALYSRWQTLAGIK